MEMYNIPVGGSNSNGPAKVCKEKCKNMLLAESCVFLFRAVEVFLEELSNVG